MKCSGVIERDRLDTLRRLRGRLSVRVAPSDLPLLLFGLVAEERLEELVEGFRALDVQLRQARLVVDSGTVAPSSTDCGIVYESMRPPKTRTVDRSGLFSMGVPVKPT